MAHPNKRAGYLFEFINDLDSRLRCPVCFMTLRSPFQTECGHRFCENCIKNVIINGDKRCPLDDTELSLQNIFQDVFCNRQILQLQCFCTNRNLGCEWTGHLRILEEHHKDCLFTEATCPIEGCNEKMLKRFLGKHMQEECMFLKQPQSFMEVGAQLADHEGLDGVMMLDAWVSEAL
ncbi:tumor necrosis factor receptor-associated factor 6 [Paramuricea clavata]|uniref:Tumor necrosis factor receptor-associated factor 6 n=1 Tax=Paramuricea clavata TaxID=317549 RepID=A0A6S7HVS8_PARCT|nr:tumor necrosis factor receptor-associated factor 6 [Paramuricea clavata]